MSIVSSTGRIAVEGAMRPQAIGARLSTASLLSSASVSAPALALAIGTGKINGTSSCAGIIEVNAIISSYANVQGSGASIVSAAGQIDGYTSRMHGFSEELRGGRRMKAINKGSSVQFQTKLGTSQLNDGTGLRGS